MKKNIENSEAPTRMPTTLAPVIVRMRKIEKGTSGARERRSIATKAISRSAAATRVPIVCAEPQPASSASTRAKTSAERPAVIVTAPATSKWRTSLLGVRFGDQAGRERRGGDPDRDVDPEHPLPAEVFGQDAAEQHAGGAAGAGDRAPDPQRFVALGAVAEGGGDDRERGGGEDRGAEALHGAGGDQLPGGGSPGRRPARRARRGRGRT